MADSSSQKETPRSTIWFGLAERRPTDRGTIRVHLRWHIVISLLLVMAVLAWGGKTVGLYYWYKYRKDFDEITLQQTFLFPFNWSSIRISHGDADIARSKTLLEKENVTQDDFRQALFYARTGVRRSPLNVEGRLHLAELEFIIGRPDISLQILGETTHEAKESEQAMDYFRFYLRLLLDEASREDATVTALADEFLPEEPSDEPIYRMIAMGAAQAHFNRGQFEAAEGLVRDYNLGASVEGVLLTARILWNRNLREPAVETLERFVRRYRAAGDEIDPIYALISRFYREMEQPRTAIRWAVERVTQNPFAAAPRIEILYAYHQMEEEDRLEREIENVLSEFDDDENAMRLLGKFATDIGDIPLSRRIYEVALENDFSLAVFGLLFIETQLVAGNYEVAVELCNELVQENPDWISQYDGVFSSLRAISYYALKNFELGELYLTRVLQDMSLRSETLVSIARRFELTGFVDQSRRILVEALRRDNENQLVLSQIVRMDLQERNARDLTDYLRQLLKLRRPSYELLTLAYQELNSDRFLFTRERDDLLADLRLILLEVGLDPEAEIEES